ncbi:putative transcriptional regulator YwtF [Catellatospora methionotrophica]|uniref:Putative transcriptional regulator YwtF n=1 Tax=Catellatospora methionotrophica TaxID=121620 RepID=A0A8J3LAF8_9ACTN|nr:LCP family protein [Catellatospora methionotrophica]GIG17318.1 putative transcriptional regulator YwtF [Catellatospora methionotrophica]
MSQRHPRTSAKPAARRKAPLWAKLVLTFGAVLMMIAGTSMVLLRSVVGTLEESVDLAGSDVLAGPSGQAAPDAKALRGAFDVLLLGIDTRPGQKADDARSDTIIIVHVSGTHREAYLMSVPRDVRVEIPGKGYRKVNGAFQAGLGPQGDWRGGLKTATQTVSKLTGITFEAAAVIDFGGFNKIIEALGSVRMCVEADTKSIHHFVVKGKPKYIGGIADATEADQYTDRTGNKRFVHRKGCRDMQAWEALDFARQRYLPDGSADYGRQRHQQQLIQAMVSKATSAGVLTDIGKVNDLIRAAGESMLLSLPQGMEVIDFFFALQDLAAVDLVSLKTNAGWYNGYKVGNESFEDLNDKSKLMFKAASLDKLGEFTALYPEFINRKAG